MPGLVITNLTGAPELTLGHGSEQRKNRGGRVHGGQQPYKMLPNDFDQPKNQTPKIGSNEGGKVDYRMGGVLDIYFMTADISWGKKGEGGLREGGV